MKDETLAIHAGFKADPATKAVSVPIYQTVAYEFDDAAHGAALFNLEVEGNIYSRIMNPTVDVLEKRVAELEAGIAGLCLSAGSAAINYAVQNIAESGNNIVTVPLLYGGTYTLFKHMLPKQGVDVRFAADDSVDAMQSLIDDKTTAIFCESIGNPAGNIVDLEALATMAHEHGVPLIVDNTVATPALIKPIKWGADIVVNSMTKYMGGHGNSLGGVIVDSGQFPWADERTRSLLSRRCLHRGTGPGSLYRACANGTAQEYRIGAESDECVPDPAGAVDVAVAHGAPLRQRAQGRQLPE
jgi:O-acetylhomoserine (thiol)-lyase